MGLGSLDHIDVGLPNVILVTGWDLLREIPVGVRLFGVQAKT